jgi:hypothetical protein
MRRLFFVSLFLSLSVITAGCQISPDVSRFLKSDSLITVKDTPQPGEVAIIDSNIIVNQPLSNAVVSSPLAITGRARVFEANVLFRLKDATEQIIASGLTTAEAAAPDWGFYSGVLEFNPPISEAGWLEVYIESAQDGSEQNLIRLPVIFKDFRVSTVTIYFPNSQRDPDFLDCSVVYPVSREIPYTSQLAAATLGTLLLGPSGSEQAEGFFTSIPVDDVLIQQLFISDGVVHADFNQALQAGVGGSCRVISIRSQIAETLKPFSDTDQVVISINGETEEILQP